jgi:alkanesulfonate monooxygenase SsuD/methylene tetrahydromethanopterin reductase-like flavin-dependent oxidoreductase (luciferase family)
MDRREWYLSNAFSVPKSDPMRLVPLLGRATTCRGIVATMTTEFYPPFPAARPGATLDHLAHGRVGLNVVTVHNDRSAQNYGLDRHYEHDLRYEMADGWMEVVNRLWESREPNAIVANPETGVFADHNRIRPRMAIARPQSARLQGHVLYQHRARRNHRRGIAEKSALYGRACRQHGCPPACLT